MAFKFPSEPKNYHVEINGKEVNVLALKDKSITLEELKTIRANTNGWTALNPKLNNEALCYNVRNVLKNCSAKDSITYEGILQNILTPLLLKRLEEK